VGLVYYSLLNADIICESPNVTLIARFNCAICITGCPTPQESSSSTKSRMRASVRVTLRAA